MGGLIAALGIGAIAIAAGAVVARSDRSGEAVLRVENLKSWAPEELPVRYCVHKSPSGFVSGEDFESIVADAFAAWAVPQEYTGACSEEPDADPYAKNGVNEIGWRPWTDPLGFTSSEMRCGRSCDPSGDHRLKEVDVIIAASPGDDFENEACLRSIVLHEVGHALGLQHVAEGSIMELSSGCVAELTEKDIEMVESRYGSDRTGRESLRRDAATLEELSFLKSRFVDGIAYAGKVEPFAADALHKFHAPRFRESCPLDVYTTGLENRIERLGDELVMRDFKLVKSGRDYAEISYRLVWESGDAEDREYQAVPEDNPDRWVLIDNRWYDDVDDNTPC